jgi:hypothetical protein
MQGTPRAWGKVLWTGVFLPIKTSSQTLFVVLAQVKTEFALEIFKLLNPAINPKDGCRNPFGRRQFSSFFQRKADLLNSLDELDPSYGIWLKQSIT